MSERERLMVSAGRWRRGRHSAIPPDTTPLLQAGDEPPQRNGDSMGSPVGARAGWLFAELDPRDVAALGRAAGQEAANRRLFLLGLEHAEAREWELALGWHLCSWEATRRDLVLTTCVYESADYNPTPATQLCRQLLYGPHHHQGRLRGRGAADAVEAGETTRLTRALA